MKLLPYTLIRSSGGPFEKFAQTDIPSVTSHLDKRDAITGEMRHLAADLSEALHPLVSAAKDDELRRQIIALRRRVYNLKSPQEAKWKTLAAHLTSEISAQLEQYKKLWKQREEATTAAGKLFPRELNRARKALRQLSAAEPLHQGLILSSQSLLDKIPRYLQSGEKLDKKDAKTEQSLLRYISRTYAKNSPFSTFNQLTFAEHLSENDPAATGQWGASIYPDTASMKSGIRLNNFLFQHLQSLILAYRPLYRQLYVRPNPTLQKSEGFVLYLTNSQNVESFQRIPESPILELFEHLTTQDVEGIRYGDMVDTIIKEEYIDAPQEDLEKYIDDLIAYGFLEFRFGVSGVDPDWDIALRKTLAPMVEKEPLAQEFINMLERVRTAAQHYEKAETAERQAIQKKAFADFRGFCMKLHEAAGLPAEERLEPEEYAKWQKEKIEKEQKEAKEKKKNQEASDQDPPTEETQSEDSPFKRLDNTYFHFRAEQIFYEDTTLPIRPKLPEPALAELVEKFDTLLKCMKLHAGYWDEHAEMATFYKEHYGATPSIPLMRFYEDYYREVKKPEEERQRKIEERKAKQAEAKAKEKKQGETPADNKGAAAATPLPEKESEEEDALAPPPTNPIVKVRQEIRKKWREALRKKLEPHITPRTPAIDLPLDLLTEFNEEFSKDNPELPQPEDNPSSYGMFIQLYREGADPNQPLCGVLNGNFPGYGRMTSRFLHLFEPEITEKTRQYNRELHPDTTLVEENDASFFNANLHPPLMPKEIWMPGGQNSMEPEDQISITQIEVCPHPQDDTMLILRDHESHQRIAMFDLGFESIRRRSPLYQLLSKFTYARMLYAQYLQRAVVELYYGIKENKEAEKSPSSDQEEGEQKIKTPRIATEPRITLEGQIVLQRKTWHVPHQLLPHKRTQESEWEYYDRLDQWRRSLGIPEHVFVYANPMGQDDEIERNIQAAKRARRDDYKPQYISFSNPFLVTLFAKLLPRVPTSLRIEEMLPAPDQLMRIGEGTHATECVVQWYDS